MKRSNIGWTDLSGDELNFSLGCSEISPGCAHCYARTFMERWGFDFHKVTTQRRKLEALRRVNWGRMLLDVQQGHAPAWRRGSQSRPMAFVVDMGDLFHDAIPDDFIYEAFVTFRDIPWVDWQVLTKRPTRMYDLVYEMWGEAGAPQNIWFGVTTEDQKRLHDRLFWLHKLPAQGVKFISAEPLLEPLSLALVRDYVADLGWVICGAESGPGRRAFDSAWAEALHEECVALGIPFFAKQDSGFRPGVPLLIRGHEVKEFPSP